MRIKILNMDNTPDLTGEYFDPAGVMVETKPVPVAYNHEDSAPNVWGFATLDKTDDAVYADIVFTEGLPRYVTEMIPKMYPSIGGRALAAEEIERLRGVD